jgi:hypothetical protein
MFEYICQKKEIGIFFVIRNICSEKLYYFSESLLKDRLKKNLSRFHQKAFPILGERLIDFGLFPNSYFVKLARRKVIQNEAQKNL